MGSSSWSTGNIDNVLGRFCPLHRTSVTISSEKTASSELDTPRLPPPHGTKGITMPAISMAGSLPTFPADAHVVYASPWSMHSAAPQKVFPHWGITRSETSQPTSWPKGAKMSASNLSFRTCQVNYCTMLLPLETMERVLTQQTHHCTSYKYNIPCTHRVLRSSLFSPKTGLKNFLLLLKYFFTQSWFLFTWSSTSFTCMWHIVALNMIAYSINYFIVMQTYTLQTVHLSH